MKLGKLFHDWNPSNRGRGSEDAIAFVHAVYKNSNLYTIHTKRAIRCSFFQPKHTLSSSLSVYIFLHSPIIVRAPTFSTMSTVMAHVVIVSNARSEFSEYRLSKNFARDAKEMVGREKCWGQASV